MDYYEVLGVPRNASEKDLKSVWENQKVQQESEAQNLEEQLQKR